jgi:hypothetical protein
MRHQNRSIKFDGVRSILNEVTTFVNPSVVNEIVFALPNWWSSVKYKRTRTEEAQNGQRKIPEDLNNPCNKSPKKCRKRFTTANT